MQGGGGNASPPSTPFFHSPQPNTHNAIEIANPKPNRSVFHTCLFCNQNLGSNLSLEKFQLGRRLAFDPDKGRLWVVCRACQRWNLSPIESRWEAIEDAERAFRNTKLRVSTDNIGLAQLSDGLQLVRIGKPPRLEMLGWRYGDQFGRRRRKHILVSTAVVAAGLAFMATPLLPSGVGAIAFSAHFALERRRQHRYLFVPRAVVHDNDGAAHHLPLNEISGTALVAARNDSSDWYVKIRRQPHAERKKAKLDVDSNLGPDTAAPQIILTGAAAHRALATALPFANGAGGSERHVREALSVMDEHEDVDQLLASAAKLRLYDNNIPGENLLAALPPRLRLALEMVLHENSERRAMEGELAELESRWREAEEIAAISDALLVPDKVEQRLESLRNLFRRGNPNQQ